MANGAVEKLVTEVSVQGADTYVQKMRGISDAHRRNANAVREATRAQKDYERTLDHAMGWAAGAGAVMTGGGILFGRNIVNTTAEVDALRQGLTAMMGSAEKANKEYAKLVDLSTKPGVGFQEAIRLSLGLQAASMSADTARSAVEEFSNAVALAGGGKDRLEYVSIALTQIATANGKAIGQEIRQLQQHVPQIRQVLKKAFGTADSEELGKMGIGSEEFFRRVLAEMRKMPRAATSLRNDLDNLSDAWTRFLYGTGASGKGGIGGGIRLITGALNAFNRYNEVTHGAAGATVLWGTATTILAGTLLTAAYGVKKLRDMWLEVAGAANVAAGAQARAAGAGAGAGGSAAAGKGGGIIAGVGKGGIIAAGIALLSGMSYGGAKLEDYGRRKKNRQAQSMGTALKWGGGPLGMIIGSATGAYDTWNDHVGPRPRKATPKTRMEQHQEDTNSKLDELIHLTKDANRTIIGGGKLAQRLLNPGNIERALSGTLAQAVIN